MGHYSTLFPLISSIMAALLFHKRKNFLYIILFFASLIAVYLWNVPRAGFSEDHAAYFDGREK